MERDKKNPMLALALALLLMAAGSLLALLHVGMSARGANQIHYSFNARGAALAASTYAGDIGRGAAIAKDKTAQVFDNFFGGEDNAAGAQTASAGSYSGEAGQQEGAGSQEDYTPDSDAFTKYYEKHYGKGAESASAGWNEGGGFGGGFGGGGGGESATSQSAPGTSRETAAGKPPEETPAQEQGAKDTPAAPPAASGGAPSSSPKSSFPQAKASAGTALSSPPPPLFPGQQPAAGGSAGAKGMKTGGLDGFNNKAGAADLDGALERASAGAKSDYGAKMSGGAAATAAAGAAAGGGGGGGGASSPVDASKDGKGAAGGKDAAKDAAKDAGSSSPVSSWWSRSGDEDTPAGAPAASAKKTADAKTTASADPELLKAIVAERRNGGEAKYLTEEDEKAAPEETLLKSGAVALTAPAEEKSLKEPDPDPEDFSKLSADRKAELKKEIHSFLKRVENKYGKMTDIEYTACKETPDFCKEHGLERSYLTMTTANKARLVMGVKYVKDRWRRYTVDFKKPAGAAVTPVPKPEQDPVPSEEPADDDEFGEDEFYE
jgi:hypothetical protein